MKDLKKTIVSLYMKHKENSEDWEQDYFNALDDELETENIQVSAKMFYDDDDTIEEIVEDITSKVKGQKVIDAASFYDEENVTSVVVLLLEKIK